VINSAFLLAILTTPIDSIMNAGHEGDNFEDWPSAKIGPHKNFPL
jgi:hypothetical protein